MSINLSPLVPFARISAAITPAAFHISFFALWGAKSVYSCIFDSNGKERQDLSKTQKTMLRVGAISLAVVGATAGAALVATFGFLGGLLGGLIGRNNSHNNTGIIIGLAVGSTLGSAIALGIYVPIVVIEIKRMRQ